MVKIDDYRYNANEGCFIMRKSDNFIMGESICLGDADSIDNYDDIEYTEESYEEFYRSIGMESPKVKDDNKGDRKRK